MKCILNYVRLANSGVGSGGRDGGSGCGGDGMAYFSIIDIKTGTMSVSLPRAENRKQPFMVMCECISLGES